MKQLFPNDVLDVSETFFVEKQITLMAFGLGADATTEYVAIQLLNVPVFKGDKCVCPPGQAMLPQASDVTELMCCGEPIRLTAAKPVIVVDSPQHMGMRLKLVSATPDLVTVYIDETDTPNVTDRMRGCPCGA